MDATDTVLGFLVPPGAGTGGVPLQSLFGFEKVFVPAGKTVQVWLGASARDFTFVTGDVPPARVTLPGEWTATFGGPLPSSMQVSTSVGHAVHVFEAQ